MDPIILSLSAILLTLLLYVIYQAWKANQYWKERGVPHIVGSLFIGSQMPMLLGKMTPGEIHGVWSKQFPNEPLFGFYDFMKPSLIVKDINLIEKILIKDFAHFTDRGFPSDDERNPLDSSLVTLTGKRWKAVRNRLTPIFTTGKLKLMFDSMTGCGKQLIEQIDNGDKQDVELKEILGCFTMDTIGIIKDTIKFRRDNGFIRNDFIQLMMQLQDKGYVEMHTKDTADDYLDIDTTKYTTEKFELSDDQISGHAVTFLTAGFDTTTLTMVFTLYELSRNPTIQDKVREEIQREVRHAGSLTYDALKELHYLEQCIKAMRFAMLAMKYCIANLLQNYTISLSPKTKQPIRLSTEMW